QALPPAGGRPVCFVPRARRRRALPSFPTRRSSDLMQTNVFLHRPYKQEGILEHQSHLLAQRTISISLQRNAVDGDLPPIRSIKRSEEHTSELQSRFDLVCRLLLEKKNPDGIERA